ncbi:MAG: glycosyltransferase [Rhizobiales bacterium]|nr:glycosyltransferase [Hyphomicrobiales bacterium]
MSLAIVLKGYPRLSETFIAQELKGLEDRGIDFSIHALRRPHDGKVHPIHGEITAPVHYLPEYIHDEPLRVLRAWLAVRRRPGYRRARAKWLADLWRQPTRNRFRRFGQAMVLAAEMPADVRHIHVHFLHTPASVARYAADALGIGWSCSAHAKDIYTTPAWEISEKLDDLEWLVTCTAANVGHLKSLAPAAANKIELVYHGIDLARLDGEENRAMNDDRGGLRAGPEEAAETRRPRTVEILSVGRAVPKKGYDDLLEALARLPAGLDWRFTHIGGGDLRKRLEARASALGLDGRITWRGAQAQAEVLEAYRRSDIFVLTSRIADDGDRDGLPNVLMEAQSQGVACLSTRVSAIPELIEDGVTGRLVDPGDVEAIAAALGELIRDEDQRKRLAAAGHRRVRRDFTHEAGIERVARRLRAHICDREGVESREVGAAVG